MDQNCDKDLYLFSKQENRYKDQDNLILENLS